MIKVNAGGTPTYITFLGGSSGDSGYAIAVDGAGNAYVTGETQSSDFPTTAGAYDTSFNGGDYDAFIIKLAAEGGPTPTPVPIPPRVYLPIIKSPGCGPDNYEPNSPCDQTRGRLIPDQTHQSYISDCDVAFGKNGEGGKGYDYFFFKTADTRGVTIVLDNTLAGKDYDLYLYRHPDCENWIEKSARSSVVETISTSLGPGTYYVLVFSPFGQYSTSPYSLQVTSP